MSDHTPGPWTDGVSPTEAYCYVRSGPDDASKPWSLIAQVLSDKTVPVGRVRANARLIAAAPQMKQLLAELSDDLEAYVQHEYRNTKDYPSYARKYERDMEPVNKARALLAKVEGRDG